MFNLKKIKFIDWLLAFFLVAGFCLQIYLIYFGYRTYNYLVPPGSDAVNHFNIIKKILDTGKIDFLSYPPGFHLLVIFLNKISHTDVFSILTYWTPILVILPSVSMYFLLHQLFDNKVSAITTLLFLLASNYPLYSFIDGNYPDILAYGVFGILLFAYLIRYVRTKNWTNLIIASFVLVLIALIHHLTFVAIIAVLAVFGLIQLYISIVEKKFWIKSNSQNFLMVLVIAILVSFSIYLAYRFYGSTVINFANGFFTNSPSNQNTYLNVAVDWSNYPLFAGNVIWYIGLVGLLFLIVTTFKERREITTKQLILVWFAVYFVMSRFAATGLPARFARELAPPLVVGIGFLLNYIFNLNSLRIHRYKLILGYGLMAFIIITNSALYVGPAKIPDSFNMMVWFWPQDQQDLNYINNLADGSNGVLYNPAANLYLPVKAPSYYVPIILTDDQLALATVVAQDEKTPYQPFTKLTVKKQNHLEGYDKLIFDLSKEFGYKYIYIGTLPPSNPDPKVYTGYAQFDAYDKVLNNLGDNGTLVKKFSNGSKLVRMF